MSKLIIAELDVKLNKRDVTITINFNGIDNSGEERNKTKI